MSKITATTAGVADAAVAEETTDTDQTPTPYEFPFEVPADLSSVDVTDETLRELHTQVRDHAQTFAGQRTEEAMQALRACRDLAVAVRNEVNERTQLAAEASALETELDEDLPEPAPAPEPVPAPADPPAEPAVTAASRRRAAPSVRAAAAGSTPAALPAELASNVYAEMVSAIDLAGFHSGQQLSTFDDVGTILSRRLDQYASLTESRSRGSGGRRSVTTYDPHGTLHHRMTKFARHPGIEIRRNYPAELRLSGEQREAAVKIIEHAGDQTRLPGGGLIQSIKQSVDQGKALTAAAGWCAPSETIYDLVELSSLDGLIDVPEIQADRGGFHIPVDGGPDFAVVYNSIGNAGDTHLSEQEVIDDTPKISVEIPCPDFAETRLGVDYLAITGGLLQRKGYPEMVARFGREAVKALAHKVNAQVIAAMVAGSGPLVTIPQDPSGDDAASSLLSALDVAIWDAKYRHRMPTNATMEVPMPYWGLPKIRAALSRRLGIGEMNVTDAVILDWFTTRYAVPRLVYDWQDSFAGLSGGPGGPSPIVAFPDAMEFLVYPSGTWTKAVQPVISLDTIYDSTLLTTNQYTALFIEDGWAMLKMGPLSRRYVTRMDPSGVVACCPGEERS